LIEVTIEALEHDHMKFGRR